MAAFSTLIAQFISYHNHYVCQWTFPTRNNISTCFSFHQSDLCYEENYALEENTRVRKKWTPSCIMVAISSLNDSCAYWNLPVSPACLSTRQTTRIFTIPLPPYTIHPSLNPLTVPQLFWHNLKLVSFSDWHLSLFITNTQIQMDDEGACNTCLSRVHLSTPNYCFTSKWRFYFVSKI